MSELVDISLRSQNGSSQRECPLAFADMLNTTSSFSYRLICLGNNLLIPSVRCGVALVLFLISGCSSSPAPQGPSVSQPSAVSTSSSTKNLLNAKRTTASDSPVDGFGGEEPTVTLVDAPGCHPRQHADTSWDVKKLERLDADLNGDGLADYILTGPNHASEERWPSFPAIILASTGNKMCYRQVYKGPSEVTLLKTTSSGWVDLEVTFQVMGWLYTQQHKIAHPSGVYEEGEYTRCAHFTEYLERNYAPSCSRMLEEPVQSAVTTARTIRNAVSQWQLSENEYGECPAIGRLIEGGQLDRGQKTTDPWGQEYMLTCADDEVIVTSFGPDRKFGTKDDIVIPKGASLTLD